MSIFFTIVSGALGTLGGIISAIYVLAIFLPSLAVAIRRLHDTDRSGWWLLIYLIPLIGFIVLLVFFVQKGTQGDNAHAPDPLGA